MSSIPANPSDWKVVKRAIDEGSWVEFAARRLAVKTELKARLYEYEGTFILAAVAGFTELGAPLILESNTDPETLGQRVCDCLLQYRPKLPGPPPAKQSDWPAYRASGARSIRSFEEHSFVVSIFTLATGVQAAASPRKSLDHDLEVVSTASCKHAAVGKAILRALQGAHALRDAGVI